jgi:ADP-dependent NAD(P)H-hydrate dehydratase / NAD(P)H-hydrate epimerase
MHTSSKRILFHGVVDGVAHPLHSVHATKELETRAISHLPAHTLMERAGLAIAQLALALCPHGTKFWIACGPGNNGGDGMEAAVHIKRWGKNPVITYLGDVTQAPADAAHAYQLAMEYGVEFSSIPPAHYDLCIDALFGIGNLRPLTPQCIAWIEQINTHAAPVLAVDLPTGLDANTGRTAPCHVRASATLSLLTLKPGLFTAEGRDACGDIWWNTLNVEPAAMSCAELNPTPLQVTRLHATHKGSYGDVAIVGGACGMQGAAWLAGTSALMGGAGRVYVGLLDTSAHTEHPYPPELMQRAPNDIHYEQASVAAGCGGGKMIADWLPRIIAQAQNLVLDADALNAIALQEALQECLIQRADRLTVLTPHPLEAARLLGISTASVQDDRLSAAQLLAKKFLCVVVLKGSGTIIAAPHELPRINATGNGRLATAGTGDVLAGLITAYMAQGNSAWSSACQAVFRHGQAATQWPHATALTASKLALAF